MAKFDVEVRSSRQLCPGLVVMERFNGFTNRYQVTAVESDRFLAVQLEGVSPGEVCLEKEFLFSKHGIDQEGDIASQSCLYKQG